MASYSIGDIARETGVHIETIRYFEKIGLLRKPSRTHGGHRVYNYNDLAAVRFIRRARMLGFSPADVRTLLSLGGADARCCENVREVAAQHLASVRAKIAELAELEHLLASTIERCAPSEAADCAVIDMLNAPHLVTIAGQANGKRTART